MENKDINKLPIDRGWAWMILLASAVQFFILVGSLKSFGILFVEYLQKYDATSSNISAVLSVQTVSFGVTSILVMGYGIRYFKIRTLVIIGTLLLTISSLGNAFSPTVSFLLLTQGVFYGTGLAIAQLPNVLILGMYFSKRRGLANSVANVGGSLGGVVWPPLLHYLLDYYGLQGTLILISGLFLNVAVCGALMRPLELPPSIEEISKVKQTKEEKACDIEKDIKQNVQLSSVYYETKQSGNGLTNHLSYEQLVPHRKKRLRTVSEGNGYDTSERMSTLTALVSKSGSYLKSSLNVYGEFGVPMCSMSSLSTIYNQTAMRRSQHIGDSNDTITKSFETPQHDRLKSCCDSIFKFSLFKNIRFVLFIFVATLSVPACALPVNYIPPHAKDCDVSHDKISLLVTISALSDLVSRTLLMFIADHKYIKRHQILMVALIINGIGCMVTPLLNSFETILIFAILYGLFGGIFFTLYPVILVDFIGIDDLKYGLATLAIVTGGSISAVTPVIGLLRDGSNSYINSFYLIGVMSIVAGGTLLLEPVARRRDVKNGINV